MTVVEMPFILTVLLNSGPFPCIFWEGTALEHGATMFTICVVPPAVAMTTLGCVPVVKALVTGAT